QPLPVRYVWAVAILFFLSACFLAWRDERKAWRDEHKRVLARQERRRIREGLSTFHQLGIELQVACETTTPETISDPEIRDRFKRYDVDAQAWLRENLDNSKLTRFSDPTGLNLVTPEWGTPTRTNIWRYVANRQARLQEFIKEYPDL